MITWILIIFAHAGPMSDKDSMALTTVNGFMSEAECRFAGDQSKKLADFTTKQIKYQCVKVSK